MADGAKDNGHFLNQQTQKHILDFYHAREYISKAAAAIFGSDHQAKEAWIEDWSHRLKHKQGTVGRLLKELEFRQANLDKRNFFERDEELRLTIVYFTNNQDRMNYANHVKDRLPIGSGVTEAACKTVVKQWRGLSGSRWKEKGASCVLALRTLKLTTGRWQQFGNYVMRHGTTIY